MIEVKIPNQNQLMHMKLNTQPAEKKLIKKERKKEKSVAKDYFLKNFQERH